MRAELGPFETILASRDHAMAVASPLLVQVRRGPMTMEALAVIDQRAREVRARFGAPGRKVAVVALLEPDAPVATNEVRAKQKALIAELIAGLSARVVVAVLGEGISPMLQRGVARGLLFANPNVRVTQSPEETAAWLAPHLGVAAAQVVSVIQRTRDLR